METALANLDDPTQTQKLRFPLSVSEGRNELDKSGAPCTVYDAVFNDDVVKQAIAFRRLKVFLVELCLQWVSRKYALSLDPKYKLPHRKYMGGDAPPPQMIRATKKKKAMIEELEGVDEEPSFPLHPKPLPKWEEKAATGGGGGGGGGGGESSEGEGRRVRRDDLRSRRRVRGEGEDLGDRRRRAPSQDREEDVGAAEDEGAFYTLVPILPRWRGERRSLRTFPGVSLRPPLGFDPRHRRLSTSTDAYELHPDFRLYRTARRRRRRESRTRRRPPHPPRTPRRAASPRLRTRSNT